MPSLADAMTALYAGWTEALFRLHASLLVILPDWLALAVWSLPTVALVMGLYRRFSPQATLSTLTREMTTLQKQMLSLNTSPAEAQEATQRYLKLSLYRLRLTVIPVLLSSLPVLPLWAGLSAYYADSPLILTAGPEWVRHWLFVFCFFSLAYSLGLKIVWRLK